MKNILKINFILLILSLLCILSSVTTFAAKVNVVINYTTNSSWTVPLGVTNIIVEAWGGGGSGGSTVTTTNIGGGGGAGGQYARKNISVTSGQIFNITIAGTRSHSGTANTNGLAGFNTTFSNGTTIQIRAAGGNPGGNGGGGGIGGLGSVVGGIGDVVYAGGSGATRPLSTSSGAGGGGAGSTGPGGNASGTTAGTGTTELGGGGGTGLTITAAGNPGLVYGGGGGGSRRNAVGGSGAAGFLRITYQLDNTPPEIKIISPKETNYPNGTILLNISAIDTDSPISRIWYSWNNTNTTYTAPTIINFTQGINTIQAWANDSYGNINYTSISFNVLNDFANPSVVGTSTDMVLYGINDSAIIFAYVYDDVKVDTVYANVTLPNGTIIKTNLMYSNLTSRFETSFTNTSFLGNYVVRIIANDTLNKINNTELAFFKIIKPNVTATKFSKSDYAEIGNSFNFTINISAIKEPGIIPLKFDKITAITNNSDAKDSPQMIVTSSGTLLIVFNQNNIPNMENGGNHDIYIARSINKGQNWTITKIVNQPEHDIFPNIFQDDLGNIIVTFTHMTDNGSIWYPPGDIWLIDSKDDGLTWNVPYAITSTPGVTEKESVMKKASNGIYYVIYEGNSGQLWMRSASDYRGTWSSPVQVTNSSYENVDPDMIIKNNEFYIAWAPFNDESNPNNQNIVFAKTTTPMSFNSLGSVAINLTNDPYRQYETSFSDDAEGNIYVGWASTTNTTQNNFTYSESHNKTSNELFIARSGNNGTTWDIRQITENNLSNGYPGLVQGSSTGLYYLSSTVASNGYMQIGFGQRNFGPDDAINITATDKIPENTTYIASYNGGYFVNNMSIWNYPVVYSGENYRAELEVFVNKDVKNGTNITNFANVTYYDKQGRLVGIISINKTIITQDTLVPKVQILQPVINSLYFNTEQVAIKINVSDNALIDKVYLNITIPNSTTSTYFANYNSSSKLYEYIISDIKQLGLYYIKILSNDSNSLRNDSEYVYFYSTNNIATTPNSLTCNQGTCNKTFNQTIQLNCSGSIDPENDSMTYYVESYFLRQIDDIVTLFADFEFGLNDFIYVDDLYGTASPTQATGQRVNSTNCKSGHCLNVQLNNNTPTLGTAYSGGWNRTIIVTDHPSKIGISFDYKMRLSDSTDQGENITIQYRNISNGAIISGNILYGIAGLIGVDQYSSGSSNVEFIVTNGTYAFDIGCKAMFDEINENADCWIDNVKVIAYNTTDTTYSWHDVGTHKQNETLSWDPTVEKTQNNVNFRCRAIDSGSLQFTNYFNANVNATIIGTTLAIISVNATPNQINPGGRINLTANISEGFGVDKATISIDNQTNQIMNYASLGKYYYDQFNTNISPGVYTFIVSANDTFNTKATPKSGNFTINAVCGISLSSLLLNFGNVSTGTESTEFRLNVSNTGNAISNLTIKGSNWIGPSILFSNKTAYSTTTGNFTSKNPLQTAEKFIQAMNAWTMIPVYFQFKPDFGTSAGTYNQNITVVLTC